MISSDKKVAKIDSSSSFCFFFSPSSLIQRQRPHIYIVKIFFVFETMETISSK